MKLFTTTLALLLAATSAQAADTATLLLRGEVAVVNNIAVKPNGNANLSLNITGGESNKLVAAVEETSNNVTGYKINVKSLNQGELRHTTDATRKTTYRLGYNGQTAIALTQNYQQVKSVSSLNGLTTASSNVVVDVQALPNAVAGTYEDTVTFQIVANN
jgi:spore coat protein U-like protein